jgi:hypothetical protein
VIVRILGEGQYDLEGEALQRLKELDRQLFAVVAAADAAAYRQAFDRVLALVRGGQRLSDQHLVESDLILPAPDTDLEAARRLFTDGG